MYTKTVYFISQIYTLKMGFRTVYFITPVYFISTVYFISPPPVVKILVFGRDFFFPRVKVRKASLQAKSEAKKYFSGSDRPNLSTFQFSICKKNCTKG